ncbi:MAG TPA: PAS domain S-box protein [Rectinemataceae bacterium]|nr:PAS domain S-box protein [Rectinemataceae bacterium]
MARAKHGPISTLIMLSCGFALALVGVVVLAGWVLGLRILTSLHPAYLPTAPDTALLFVLVGVIVATETRWKWGAGARKAAALLLVLVGLYGGLKFLEGVVGTDLSFAGRLFPVSERLRGFPLRRMSPIAGFLFLLGAAAMILRERAIGRRRTADLVGLLGSIVALLAFVAVLGYLFGTPLLYRGTLIPLAAPSSFAFLLWGTAIVASVGSKARPFRRFVGRAMDARLMRSIVPLTVAFSLGGGLLQSLLAKSPKYDALESSLITLTFLAASAVVVMRASRRVFRRAEAAELEMRRLDDEKRESERKYRRLYEGMRDGYTIADPSGRYLESNAAFRELVGYSDEELRSLSVLGITPEKWHPLQRRIMEEEVLVRGYSELFEKEYRRKDGRVIPVELRIFLIRDEAGGWLGTCSVVRDISERKKAEAGLRESEERFRAIFENAGIGMALVDKEGRITRANASLAAMLDYQLSELEGRSLMELTHPDDRESDWNLYLNLIAGARDSYQIEKRYLRKDGRVIWGQLTASTFCIPSEGCSIIGMVEDVTSRRAQDELIRRSLGEKEALLRELHHRVKNNLQLITSLLSLQGASLPEGPAGDAVRVALHDATGRVGAMAGIHELVYLSKDFSEIDFGAYMASIARGQLLELGGSRPIRLDLDLEELRISLDDAIPCGLLINEALSNVAKYAYPPDWPGQRRAELSLRRSAGGRRRIVIRDHGVGIQPDQPESRGLGLHIMRILSDQIGGRLEVRSEDGVEVQLEF